VRKNEFAVLRAGQPSALTRRVVRAVPLTRGERSPVATMAAALL